MVQLSHRAGPLATTLLLVAAALAWPAIVAANDGGEQGTPQGYSGPLGVLLGGASLAAGAAFRKGLQSASQGPPPPPDPMPNFKDQSTAYNPGGFQQGPGGSSF